VTHSDDVFFYQGFLKSQKQIKASIPCCLIVVQIEKHRLDVDTEPAVAFMLCW
jgi:hypothetical protein